MGTASLNADYHVELIAGREVPKPLPKRLHWIIQARIFRELLKWEGSLDVEVGTEVDILCGPAHDERLIPDVAVVSKNGQYRDGVLVSGAILAVEIMSPGQTIGQLFDKCEKLHAADTRDCWVLWPKKRAAWHYSAGGLPIPVTDTLIAGTIRVDVAPLFANLPDDEESAS
jgi:Uma2 family endonuclease